MTPANNASDPGRVTLHRLNRAEYNNTVRDLLGTSQAPADDFPADDEGNGFDNMANVLTLSPLHAEAYLGAARALVAEALSSASGKAAVVKCDLAARGEACARDILRGFAGRAWRRPATDAEVDSLMSTVAVATAHADGLAVGVELALRRVLLSPHFIFRVELDPTPNALTRHPLQAYELASRLSYFLWSSMPDDALLQTAESGALLQPDRLRAEAHRMLADPKSAAFVANFAGQWLGIRGVAKLTPATAPGFDVELQTAAQAETARLFGEIAFSQLPADQLLLADFTFVNNRLAKHYGLPLPGSNELARVSLAGNQQRQGLLSQAGFLTITSHPGVTSPVRRGKWVMQNLLCTDVPPPPPNVNTNAATDKPQQGLSRRQTLEAHRQNPVCATCHQLMDPIGFGLENYDAIGAYRTTDGGQPIDSAGVLPSGERFSGARELAQIIVKKPEFARCIAAKVFTYALGRPPSASANSLDSTTLSDATTHFVANGYSFVQLLDDILASPSFRERRGDDGREGTL